MAETPKRKTEKTYIPGKGYVTTGVSAAEGSEDTTETTKAKFLKDAPAVGSVKSKPWPNRKDFASDDEWQKAYDARRKEQMGGKPVSSVNPEDIVRHQLRKRYGGGTLGSMGMG